MQKQAFTHIAIGASFNAIVTALSPTFLDFAPPLYRAVKLKEGEHLTIDGLLNDPAWADADWTTDLVDITDHLTKNGSVATVLNAVPKFMQMKCKIRWDDQFLYIGAILNEPYVRADVPPGDNTPQGPPYHDNDFEVFLDVSGTSQYYKEFEMSARNATYDVLWGVPDGMDPKLDCVQNYSSPNPKRVPICTNTSAPFYEGTWSMFDRHRPETGLQSATHYDTSSYSKYTPGGKWSVEVAFPIDSSYKKIKGTNGTEIFEGHGGLMDAGPPYSGHTFKGTEADPRRRNSVAPVYWHIDVSRAEHPRHLVHKQTGEVKYCPLDCPTDDPVNWVMDSSPLNKSQCQTVLDKYPTLLGIYPWSCYWEWAVASVGPYAYMHRPRYWMTVQMVDPTDTSAISRRCRDIEWPGRYLARTMFEAQQVIYLKTGRYTNSVQDLVQICATEPDKCGRQASTNLEKALNSNELIKITTGTEGASFDIQLQLQFEADSTLVAYNVSLTDQNVVVISYKSGKHPNVCL